MDVDRRSFHWQLPRMLRALADAHFVAIDLELSGIQSKTGHRPRAVGNGSNEGKSTGGKQTLQERYKEAKEAAERYQILQVGITIVNEDAETGTYTARPYNFYLNPILEVKLDIERIFSFQSGAVEFLLSHGFNMQAPFTLGVPYLSREEEIAAMDMELVRQDKAAIADIHLRSDEVESIRFVRKVREDIEKWKNREGSWPEFLNIAPDGHSITQFTEKRGLNNYQKRLVHQLVRAEFPEFVSISRPGFIQIIPYDKEREDALQKTKMKGFEEKLARQIGLRWLVEGMVCGDLNKIDPISFASCLDGNPVWLDLKELQREFNEVQTKLSSRRTVLVGHNLFMDLINFYKCFFGVLPKTISEFQELIHGLFPLIVDTKYMSTHNNSNINARSGLDELDADLHKMTIPTIALHKDHTKYSDLSIAHEAGYDSLMTARVVIRLAAKLEAAGHYVDSDDDAEGWHTPTEDGGVLIDLPNSTSPPKPDPPKRPSTANHFIHYDPTAPKAQTAPFPSLRSIASTPPPTIPRAPTSQPEKPRNPPTRIKTPFSHVGMFDALDNGSSSADDDDEESLDPAGPEIPSLPRAAPLIAGSFPNGWDTPLPLPPAGPKELDASEQPASRLMPSWDSDFWNVYGNKLRVNGTVEGMCELVGR
ncbi:hypothetical protein MMC34_001370 [Xylographa carneopallida]|nr:hypothetical protein [Xylographa carneopallida]